MWLLPYFLILGDEDEVKDRENKQENTLLCDWIKQQLGDNVAKVQVSNRLSSSPCVLVSGKFGWSANMERLDIFFKNHAASQEVYHSSCIRLTQSVIPVFQINEGTGSWRPVKFGVYEREENIGD